MTNIIKNFMYNFFYQMLAFLLPLITMPYLSRVLGPEKTGIYSYSYSIAYYFVLVAMLGLNNYGNREVAKVRDNKKERSIVFWSIYFMQFFCGSIIVLLYSVYCLFVRNEMINWILLVYVISGIVDINWFFWGLEEFRITVTRNIIIKISTVVGIISLVKTPTDLWIYATLMAASMLISPLLLWPYLVKRVEWYKPNFSEIISHLIPNLVLFIPVVAVSLYKVMDKIMLGMLSTYEEVGYYDYSEKVISIPVSIVNSLGIVMLPRMSNLVSKNNRDQEERIIYYSILFGTGLTIAMSFGLMGIADVFVPFFFGEGYLSCIGLFYILLPSCVFMSSANIIRTQYLIPHSMDKEYTLSVILGAIVNLIINAIMIPHFKSVGASIGTLTAEISVCMYQFICVRRVLPIKRYIQEIIISTGMASVMFVVVYCIPYIGNSILTMAIKVFVGCVIFGTLYIVKNSNIIRKW